MWWNEEEKKCTVFPYVFVVAYTQKTINKNTRDPINQVVYVIICAALQDNYTLARVKKHTTRMQTSSKKKQSRKIDEWITLSFLNSPKSLLGCHKNISLFDIQKQHKLLQTKFFSAEEFAEFT